jgi:hypothetical protein
VTRQRVEQRPVEALADAFFAWVVGDFGETFNPDKLPDLAPGLANRF